MFSLCGVDFPKDGAALRAALGEGLRPLGLDAGRVVVEGALPALSLLKFELSGAVFRAGHRPAVAVAEGIPGFFSRRVEVLCRPAMAGGVAFVATVGIDDAVFSFARDAAGCAVLVLDRCGAGVLELAVERAEVEKAVLAAASTAAEEQGATVKSVAVRWEQDGLRALTLSVDARAKAMFIETGVTATGRVEVTDALAVVVSGLRCGGDGMMGNLAASFLRKEIPKYEGRSVSLAGALGGLRLGDVTLHCEREVLRVRATLAGV